MAITYSMDSLKHKLAEILDVIPRHSSVVYLDYPLYGNVGDLLIMKGTEAFFETYGIKVRERWNAENFIPGRRIPKDAIIVCQGGRQFRRFVPSLSAVQGTGGRTLPGQPDRHSAAVNLL